MVFSANVCMILSLISLLLCYTFGTHFYEWMRKLLHAHFIFWMRPNHNIALFTSLDSSVLCCLSCISLSIALEINYFSWLRSFLFLSGILISRQTFSLITQKFKLKRVPAVDRLSCVSTVKGKSSQGCLLGQVTIHGRVSHSGYADQVSIQCQQTFKDKWKEPLGDWVWLSVATD